MKRAIIWVVGVWVCVFSCVRLFATPWTVACQAPLSVEFSSRLPFRSPGDLPNPGIEPWSPAFQADSFFSEPTGKPTGVNSHSLLQGILPTQGSNPGLPHCRQILYHLSYQGSPRNTGVGSLSLLQGIFLTLEIFTI